MKIGRFPLLVLFSVLFSSVALAQAVARPNQNPEDRFARDCKSALPFEVDPIAADGTVTKPRDLLALEEAHKGKPNDVTLTADLAETTYLFGVRLMCTSMAVPKVKYPVALRLLRDALKLNPNHEGARGGIEVIESIYKALGKPVPEETPSLRARPN